MTDKRITRNGEFSDSDDDGDNRKHEQSFKEKEATSTDKLSEKPRSPTKSVVELTKEEEESIKQVLKDSDAAMDIDDDTAGK